MTIHLPADLENFLHEEVRNGRFASESDAVTEAIRRLKVESHAMSSSQTPPPENRPIWEVFAEISASVPDEEWAKLPTDGAEQHDHYIYGTPKRTPTP